jgi:hypothetical protein
MVQTSEFVRKQIEAMKSDVFELGLFRAASTTDQHLHQQSSLRAAICPRVIGAALDMPAFLPMTSRL